MTGLPRKGDCVRFNTSQGETQGRVERIVTETTRIKGHVAKASKQHPEAVVRSERSGKEAIHEPDALRPVRT